MAYLFNGSTFSLAAVGGASILTDVGITSMSFAGGTRPEVDVTSSADATRVAAAGLRSPRTMEVELHLALADLGGLADSLKGCSQVAATVKVKPDCATEPAAYFSNNGFLMSFDIQGNLDGTYQLSMSIMIDESDPTPASGD